MNKLTNNMGTADWLRATEEMSISGYIEVEPLGLKFTREDFEEALKKISRLEEGQSD